MFILETLEGENYIYTSIREDGTSKEKIRLPNSYSKTSRLRYLGTWITSSPSNQIINPYFNFYLSKKKKILLKAALLHPSQNDHSTFLPYSPECIQCN